MKYFNNIKTAEELRAKYRELCLTMHPDKGGNEEEFKTMQAEFEQLKRLYSTGAGNCHAHMETAEERERRHAEEQREREEAKRREEEARRQREEEKRREAERIAKAQEEARKAVAAWAGRLERVTADSSGKARYYNFADKKQAAAYVATVKRNVKAVINYYFPGLKVKVNISGKIWQEKFTISWEDGPTEAEFLSKCEELRYFIPSYFESDPFADYGSYHYNAEFQPWHEAFGQALGDITNFETSRTLSEKGMQQAEAIAAGIFSNWKSDDDESRLTVTLSEFHAFRNALGLEDDDRVLLWGWCMEYERTNEDGETIADVYYSTLRKNLKKYAPVNVAPAEEKPVFKPTYGPTYKAIKKALGGNVFAKRQEKNGKNEWVEISIFEALLNLDGVKICKPYQYDGKRYFSPLYFTSITAERNRKAKFFALGIEIDGASVMYTSGALFDALTKEAAEVEAQRVAWEAGQAAEKAAEEPKEAKRTTAKADAEKDATSDEKPAEGLQLIEIAGGVAVVAEKDYITYFNRKQIKAHGAKWNGNTKRWEATTAEGIATLRAWFGIEPEPEKAEEQEQPAGDVSPLAEALADFFGVLARIVEESRKFEGVTIPAETLHRWQESAADSANGIAGTFAEVCACLGSLTPDARKEFDAIGVIFWTLSEQLRNGSSAEAVAPGMDLTKALLFDLIERTQSEQQAAAIKAIFSNYKKAV